MGGIANIELERVWKDTVMTYFKILFQHLCGGAEENQEYLGWQHQDSNARPPEYEAGMPIMQL
jgi:hypothetical protein